VSSLKNDIRDFMTSVGAVCEGHTGSDHVKYVLPNGQPYFTGLTPSDRRALNNVKSDVRRMLGLGSEPGKKAASYSRLAKGSGFSMESAKRDQQHSSAIREITTRATAAIYRIDAQLLEAQRNRNQREGERLVEQYMAAKATLERYFQPVPELTCKSSAVMAVAA
jgi:hypothetical protein